MSEGAYNSTGVINTDCARGSARTTLAARMNILWLAIACGGNFVGEGLGETESLGEGVGESDVLGDGSGLGEVVGAGVTSTTADESGLGAGDTDSTTGSAGGVIASSASD